MVHTYLTKLLDKAMSAPISEKPLLFRCWFKIKRHQTGFKPVPDRSELTGLKLIGYNQVPNWSSDKSKVFGYNMYLHILNKRKWNKCYNINRLSNLNPKFPKNWSVTNFKNHWPEFKPDLKIKIFNLFWNLFIIFFNDPLRWAVTSRT